MNIRKQLKVAKKMGGVGVTISRMRPGKLKGLKVAKRIKAIKKMNVAKRLRRLSFTTNSYSKPITRIPGPGSSTSTNINNSASAGGKWIANVRKKISSSRPKFPHYNNKGRNNSSSSNNNKNMIIIHNNTSITSNDELDNRTSCVDETKDITPLEMKDDHFSSPDDQATNNLEDEIYEQLTPELQQEDVEIIRLREEKAAIHIQSVFRGHLARRACRALKSLVKLQAMARGVCVRRQARIAMDCMNALLRLQFRVRARQLLLNSSPTSQEALDHPSLD